MTHTLGSANLLCPMPVTLLRALADGKPKFLTNTQAGMFNVTDPELRGPWQTGGQGLGCGEEPHSRLIPDNMPVQPN